MENYSRKTDRTKRWTERNSAQAGWKKKMGNSKCGDGRKVNQVFIWRVC